jgi:hypothetical protein
VKVTTHLHLAPRRLATVPPVSHTSSGRDSTLTTIRSFSSISLAKRLMHLHMNYHWRGIAVIDSRQVQGLCTTVQTLQHLVTTQHYEERNISDICSWKQLSSAQTLHQRLHINCTRNNRHSITGCHRTVPFAFRLYALLSHSYSIRHSLRTRGNIWNVLVVIMRANLQMKYAYSGVAVYVAMFVHRTSH